MLQRYAASNCVLSEAVDEEVVLLNLDSTCYFGLNSVGATVWDCLTKGHTIGETVAIVESRYEAHAEPVAADVLALVQSLLAQGLLTPRPESVQMAPGETKS